MARGDLLISLVQASTEGDLKKVRSTAEAIIADERVKNHHILADRLTRAMANGSHPRKMEFAGSSRQRWRDYAIEFVPRRRLEDIVLPDITRQACANLLKSSIALPYCAPIHWSRAIECS